METVDDPGIEKLVKVPPHHAPLVDTVQLQLKPGEDVPDHQLEDVVEEPRGQVEHVGVVGAGGCARGLSQCANF